MYIGQVEIVSAVFVAARQPAIRSALHFCRGTWAMTTVHELPLHPVSSEAQLPTSLLLLVTSSEIPSK